MYYDDHNPPHFMQSIMEIRQLLKLIQLDASRELCHQDS